MMDRRRGRLIAVTIAAAIGVGLLLNNLSTRPEVKAIGALLAAVAYGSIVYMAYAAGVAVGRAERRKDKRH